MSEARHKSNKDSRNPIVRFFANLGPGLITGAADDDPSGIATYSTAGALWEPVSFGLRSSPGR